MATVSGASGAYSNYVLDADNPYRLNPNTLSSQTAIIGKDATSLDMNDFFSLLVAQMTNQDMLNPMENTEFIAQMAQFTTLQGINTIMEYQLSSYATSYVGKNVSIAYTGESGNLLKTEGVVQTVTFYDGEPKVVVNGVSYPLYSVMEVKASGSSSLGSDDTLSSAASYIGKQVRVEYNDDNDNPVKANGIVTGVTLKDGKAQVIVDDKQHPVSAIQEVVG